MEGGRHARNGLQDDAHRAILPVSEVPHLHAADKVQLGKGREGILLRKLSLCCCCRSEWIQRKLKRVYRTLFRRCAWTIGMRMLCVRFTLDL